MMLIIVENFHQIGVFNQTSNQTIQNIYQQQNPNTNAFGLLLNT